MWHMPAKSSQSQAIKICHIFSFPNGTFFSQPWAESLIDYLHIYRLHFQLLMMHNCYFSSNEYRDQLAFISLTEVNWKNILSERESCLSILKSRHHHVQGIKKIKEFFKGIFMGTHYENNNDLSYLCFEYKYT